MHYLSETETREGNEEIADIKKEKSLDCKLPGKSIEMWGVEIRHSHRTQSSNVCIWDLNLLLFCGKVPCQISPGISLLLRKKSMQHTALFHLSM